MAKKVDVIVFITQDTEFGSNEPNIIVCKDENSFEKRITEYLEEYFKEHYDDVGVEYLNICDKENYAKFVLNEVKKYCDTYCPNDSTVKFSMEHHRLY